MAELHFNFKRYAWKNVFSNLGKITEIAEDNNCNLDIEKCTLPKKFFILSGTEKNLKKIREKIWEEGIPIGGNIITDKELKEKIKGEKKGKK